MHYNLYPIAIRLKKMRNKAVDASFSAKQFVSDQYKTREICDKAVDTCPFAFGSVFNKYKNQKI